MTDYTLSFQNVTKLFGRRLIFKDINANFSSGNIYGFSGRNGSGKSTLIKIAAGLISPTSGKIIHSDSGKEVIEEKLHNKIGFVSPYLVLYDEFNAEENLYHFAKIRGINLNQERVEYLLNEFEPHLSNLIQIHLDLELLMLLPNKVNCILLLIYLIPTTGYIVHLE